MAKRVGSHAVVVGSGMAGLLSARVLADWFDHVTVIERDHLPENPEHRHGVPQARHAHFLLAGGRRVLDELYHGLSARLLEEGAVPVRWTADLLGCAEFGWMARKELDGDVQVLASTRWLLDWVVRQRTFALPNVTVRARTEVTGLLARDDGLSVDGVRIRSRAQTATPISDGSESVIRADVVVDAGGRSSQGRKWLRELGLPVPAVSRLDTEQVHATRIYRRPPGAFDEWKALHVFPSPRTRAGACLTPIEGDRWMATLIGYGGGTEPPATPDAFLAFAKTLVTPLLHDTIMGLEPDGPVFGFRRSENIRYHYERLPRRLEGYLVIGDAVCALNPIYAQGMTVAAFSAKVLAKTLAAAEATADLSELTQNFQKSLAKCHDPIWRRAVRQDMAFLAAEQQRPTPMQRMANQYMNRVGRAAFREGGRTQQAYIEVIHMMRRSTSLLAPHIVWQALRSGGTGRLHGP
ncbi:FAD-dependent monooxygenase [Streptomyces sp. KS 21]|uniref:NAD(P)/FAD-dependent oxidoreductase n=1 Tax=Streptomyces sp. KS 21 TaxID=2485150 RepID=UPI00106307F9|nr:FAD-dependent monooxygenase [Streptomyces sp. KS 21]TDU73566.1 flavin-dependent dehydrogenase [Streptomyces sp. KS 21]